MRECWYSVKMQRASGRERVALTALNVLREFGLVDVPYLALSEVRPLAALLKPNPGIDNARDLGYLGGFEANDPAVAIRESIHQALHQVARLGGWRGGE